jgi:RNA-binding protein YhbY
MTNTRVTSRPHTVPVGKEGLTDSVLVEMKNQLKRHKLIRVQLNRELAGGSKKNDMKRLLAEKLNAKIVHAVGFVVVLEKR